MSLNYYRKFIYYRILDELEIQILNPHMDRHTFSNLLNKNVLNEEYITWLIGDTDYYLTANVYTFTDIEELK